MKLTASVLVYFVNQLNSNKFYNYINPSTKGLISIVSVDLPEGPIRIKRWDPAKGQTNDKAKTASISKELLWRVANSMVADQPINLDRVLGASYNTRSVLETLLAHTPNFFFCYPGRIEDTGGKTSIKKGHKHIVWMPEQTHENGKLQKIETDKVISEIPSLDIVYDSLVLPEYEEPQMDIDIKRRHAQIQYALYFIGKQLNFTIWIAQNDKGITYQGKKLGEYDGVIYSLENTNQIRSMEGAVKAALHIDCIWFKNGRLIPAIMEIEHSTGVTSGLTRMKKLHSCIPGQKTRYVIVAPDEVRSKVIREGNSDIFKDLDVRFFPYSAVEELYSMCKKRKLRGVTEEFLDCYMEHVLKTNEEIGIS